MAGSAYDNDDMFFRIATLVEMVGVLVVASACPTCSLARGGREPRQRGHGRRLRRHARRDGRALAAGRQARSRAPHDCARLRDQHLDRPGRLGRADLPRPPDRHDVRHRGLILVRARRTAVRRAASTGARRGMPTTSPSAMGCSSIITLGEVVLGTILAISAVVEARGWTRRGRAHRARRHCPRVRAVVGVLHDAVGHDARPLSAARLRLGLRPHRPLRRARSASAQASTSRRRSSRTKRTSTRRSPS